MTGEKSQNGQNRQNRLAFEKSPYLLQHAGNPVDWYPWGAPAFDRARSDNKPVFLSIGYSTCHWCHVMAHESFEDPVVAQMMNDAFVSVKVDREERPDIDSLYMAVCQMLTGSGGWPLTIIMTPDKQPFFAGTYIPRETRFGLIGLKDLIPRIRRLWETRQAEAIGSARQIIQTLRESSRTAPGEEIGESMLHLAYEQFAARFDGQHGGFGTAPKFPTAHNLFFLLRYWKRTGDKRALDMVEQTLRAMRQGGIYDHIGFGFHRYSTDERWLVPHFEKMLYDQALLVMAYVEAYQATRNQDYERTAREILTYVLRDMTSDGGGFYSAEDADSEGEEGKFYLWTEDEIREALSHEEADLFIRVFSIKSGGNFAAEAGEATAGRNIPYLTKSLAAVALELGMPVAALEASVESSRQKLFERRRNRVHPQKDDKILTDWNGLMVGALARAAQVFGDSVYADAARRAVDFVLDKMVTGDRRLLHRYRAGESAFPAHVDDYAFLILGMLDLFEATFETRYLRKAMELNEALVEHFWDEENGGFYFTADDQDGLLVRQKEIYDGAVPSGNSVAMLNLLRLGRLTGNAGLEEKAARTGRAFFETVHQSPSAFTQLMTAVDFAVGPSFEIVVAGDSSASDATEMIQAVRREFLPSKVLVLIDETKGDTGIRLIVPFVGEMSPIGGKATAYVCHNYKCKLPTNDVDVMLRSLKVD